MTPRQGAADKLMAEILRTFGVQLPPSTRWHRRLADLRWVLQTDYASTVATHVRDDRLPLRDMAARARTLYPEFDEASLHVEELVGRIADPDPGPGVHVRLTPYGRSGHPLRGFYHRGDEVGALIWVNLRHVSTAVAASLAHEVGHWLWDDLQRSAAGAPRPFYNAAFAAHLHDPRELFADAFTTMAAYPREAARRFFARSRWRRTLSGVGATDQATVAAVHAYLHREYGADLGPQSRLSLRRRFNYITSMIHFAKVRAAVLDTVGL